MEDFDFMGSLTWGELAEMEDYLDTPMDAWDKIEKKAKLSFAMQYILAKRNDAALTIDVAKNMTIAELTNLAGVEILAPKEVSQP